MRLFGLFGKTPLDPELEARRVASERDREEVKGDYRNKVQTIQSHSRRLQIMAGALALREGYDAQDDE